MNTRIFIVVNKENKPLMFVDEPTRTETTWTGNHYVNSVLYKDVVSLVKQANLNFNCDPEIIEFNLQYE